jgi:hypothetical protein
MCGKCFSTPSTQLPFTLFLRSTCVSYEEEDTCVASVSAHPLPNCHLYYSQGTVEPQKSIDYVWTHV